MASAYKTWRQKRREEAYWLAARARSKTMLAGEVVANIDLALMAAGQTCTRYRQAMNQDDQDIQLHELRMQLESSLGMLDNVLP